MTLEQLIEEKAFQTMTGHMIMVDDLLNWMLEQAQEGRVTLAMVSQGKGDEVPMMKMEPFQTIDKSSKNYAAGWNACRAAMLAASQEQK